VTSTKLRDIAIGVSVPIAVSLIVIVSMTVVVLVILKVQSTKGGEYHI
jgi:hypothetical protein